jgi:hypothetical protein
VPERSDLVATDRVVIVRLTCLHGHSRDLPNATTRILLLLRLCALLERATCLVCSSRITRVEEVVLS